MTDFSSTTSASQPKPASQPKDSAAAKGVDLEGKAAAAQKTIDEVVDTAADKTAELRKAFEERASAARDWAADQTDVIRDTVQTKPFIAVGVSAASAFAAGLILGVLLTRR